MKMMMQCLRGLSLVAIVLAGTQVASAATASAADFQARCAGALKCVSFDTDADFNRGKQDTMGGWGQRSGILAPYGTTNFTLSTRDTTMAASGASSLKFTIPANSGSDSSGSYFTNFTDDLSYQVGEGQEVYVQWRQRFSPELLNTQYQAADGSLANGWKLADISAGDTAQCSASTANSTLCPTSCWDFETVIQNTNQKGLPQVYTNCSGQFPYYGLTGMTTNVTVQNVVKCLYPDFVAPPCVKFYPNEWMTFQVHIKVGHWDTWDSTIQMWVAREGQPSQLIIDCSSTATNPCTNSIDNQAKNGWYLHNSDKTYKIGKVWLLPYHTNKSATQTNPVAYTWYDDLIISKTKIADPTPGVRPNPPTNVTAK